MWKWYLGAVILDLIGLGICLFFVFRHKRKAKAIEHYEDIRDELTVRKEITKEAFTETARIGGFGIIGNLVGAFVIITVGISVMGAMEEGLEEVYATGEIQEEMLPLLDMMPIFMIVGLIIAGAVIIGGGFRSARI